ncbi:MAG: hypothetical protein QMD36_03615, partial [Candidatus Aenigmarchaeota archaeon]|nr:hypothetical protein [Candidatus Aenigmarchaeota archaeon]
MDKIKLSFLTILIIFLLNFSSVFSLECKLTQGSDCETGWTCVFSLYNYTNSHIAECNLKDDYTVNVCCQESGYNLYVKYRTTDCEANEGGVISYYSSYNSHASEYKLDVDAERNVCLQSTKGTLKCGIVPTANSECLISLWQAKNSHVANCSDVDYKIKIYCGYETPPTYVLTVETLVERYNIPLSDVEVTVPGVGTKKTDESGIAQFDLAPGPSKKISVPVTSNYRNFSHFWDHDCDSTNLNWYLDTDGSPVNSNREFTFEMYKRPRTITAYYKINTEIDDLNYDVTKAVIAGKLFDEGKQGLLERFSSHPTCSGDGVEYRHPNRNVKLYYWDGSWIPISDAYSDLSGDFSKDWKCPLGVWNVQARYYPDLPPDGKNWYYTSSIAEMVVDCRPPDLSKSHSPANPKPGDDVTFKATANDANSGLAEIKIYVNGVLKKTCTYNGETTPQTCSYIEKVSAGTYNYYANATDMAGNWRRMPETGFNMFEITTTTTSTTTSTTSSTTTSSTTTSSTTTSSTTTSSTTTSSTTTSSTTTSSTTTS